MSQLDDLVEHIRAAAGAEFAFVLTRQGKLVTRDSPGDMPEAGRRRLVRAANQVAGTGAITSVSLPRGEIVPYGGPGPIDVSLAVAAERAIVCVVMTATAGRPRAVVKLREGIKPVEALVLRALASQTGGRNKWKDAPGATAAELAGPARSARAEAVEGKRRAGAPKSKRTAEISAPLPEIPSGARRPAGRAAAAPIGADKPEPAVALPVWRDPRVVDAPDIVVEHAPKIGRETLSAIEADLAAAGLPRVHIPESQLADTAPDIVVERARKVGRETMSAIEAELAESGVPIPAPRIAPATLRQTLPWVELPPDSELAARASRKGAGPRASVKPEEADDELLRAALSAQVERIMDNPGVKPSPSDARSEARKGIPAEVKGPVRRT